MSILTICTFPQGDNFGGSDGTPTVALGSAICGTTLWTTSTAVHCGVPYVAGAKRLVGITVGQIIGTSIDPFTFDAPVLSEVRAGNAPLSTGASITLSGFNFGGVDKTATMALGKTSCITVSWTSDSSLHCLSARGVGSKLDTLVSVSEVVGSRLFVFTYDGPVVSYVIETSSMASTTLLTINGKNLLDYLGLLAVMTKMLLCRR